jgi:hypothetical protein
VNFEPRARITNVNCATWSPRSLSRGAGLLGDPVRGGMCNDAEDVSPAGGVFDDDEAGQPGEEHDVTVDEVTRRDPPHVGAQELGPGWGTERRETVLILARLRIAQTVQAPTWRPMPASSPAIRRYPPPGFSLARCRITLRSDGDVGGCSDRWRWVVPRRVITSECQRRSVPGVTNSCR